MFKNALENYILFCREVRLLKMRTLKEYRYVLSAMNNNYDLLKASSQHDIENAIVGRKLLDNWSGNYTAKVSCILKAFYAWAYGNKVIEFNPYTFSRFKRPSLKEPDFLAEEDFELIAQDPRLCFQDLVLLRLIWDTGIRRCEAVALNREDIDFGNNVIHVWKDKSKGEYNGRFAPFTLEAKYLLERQVKWVQTHAEGSHLFVNSDFKRLDEGSVTDLFRKIGVMKTPKRDAIRLHPHKLRHSLGGRLTDAGAPQAYIMRLLGHSSMTMTTHYSHYSKKQVIENYNKYLTK
jgi:integrase/recombinase XerD